jgi:hypothetical protein
MPPVETAGVVASGAAVGRSVAVGEPHERVIGADPFGFGLGDRRIDHAIGETAT